jgi:hypothetical protein
MHVIRTDEPPPKEMDIVLRALEPFTLFVRDEAPLAVSAGTLIAFEATAFEESPMLCEHVDELINCGTLEWIRHGGTVN